MDFSHYSDHPVRMAVDLVNSFDVSTGEDDLKTPADIGLFVESHDDDWCKPGWKPSDRDLHEVRALRSRLRAVFDASDESEAADLLNDILADVNAVPRVSVHGPGPHLHFESQGGSTSRYLGAITAMGLSVALIEGGFERFGVCHSATCEDVFVDASRNRSRRHCSDTCTTREAVAAHRARQKLASEPTPSGL
ncbi:MAG: CGNR zinc finger domain-containing protein [Acidimicrobiia bacterium]